MRGILKDFLILEKNTTKTSCKRQIDVYPLIITRIEEERL